MINSYQNLSLVSCMDEENSSLWPWVLGLMAFKVYKNKNNLIKTF